MDRDIGLRLCLSLPAPPLVRKDRFQACEGIEGVVGVEPDEGLEH